MKKIFLIFLIFFVIGFSKGVNAYFSVKKVKIELPKKLLGTWYIYGASNDLGKTVKVIDGVKFAIVFPKTVTDALKNKYMIHNVQVAERDNKNYILIWFQMQPNFWVINQGKGYITLQIFDVFSGQEVIRYVIVIKKK